MRAGFNSKNELRQTKNRNQIGKVKDCTSWRKGKKMRKGKKWTKAGEESRRKVEEEGEEVETGREGTEVGKRKGETKM